MAGAYYLALIALGFLLGAPVWMAYERRCAADRREWLARRQAREARR